MNQIRFIFLELPVFNHLLFSGVPPRAKADCDYIAATKPPPTILRNGSTKNGAIIVIALAPESSVLEILEARMVLRGSFLDPPLAPILGQSRSSSRGKDRYGCEKAVGSWELLWKKLEKADYSLLDGTSTRVVDASQWIAGILCEVRFHA